MSIEVEIRAKIEDSNSVKKALEEKGADFIGVEGQVDKIFGAKRFLDGNNMIIEGGLSARIRETKGKRSLEFKEILREKGAGIELSCDVPSIEIGEKMLNKLEFEEAFTVKKEREIYSYNNFTICLDKVDKLGSFIEVEKLVDKEKEITEGKQGCLDLLNELVPKAQIENRKYGDLMQELKNQKKDHD